LKEEEEMRKTLTGRELEKYLKRAQEYRDSLQQSFYELQAMQQQAIEKYQKELLKNGNPFFRS